MYNCKVFQDNDVEKITLSIGKGTRSDKLHISFKLYIGSSSDIDSIIAINTLKEKQITIK